MRTDEIRRNQRQPADQRRKALMDATMRCLAANGVDRTSVRNICAEAGVSIGLVSHYYDGKEALIADVYEQVANRLLGELKREIARTEGGPRQRLSAFIRASFSPVSLDRELLQVWLSFWSMTQRSERISAVHDRTYGAYLQVLESLIGDLAQADGAAGPDVHLAAIGLSGVLDGLWVEWCLNPRTFSPEEGIRLCEACLEGLLAHPLERDRDGEAPLAAT